MGYTNRQQHSWMVDTRSNGVSNYVAGGLYIPFVLWVIFRMLLNLDIAWNNGHVRFYYREDIVTTVPVGPSKTSQKAATVTVYKSSSTTGNRVPYTSRGLAFWIKSWNIDSTNLEVTLDLFPTMNHKRAQKGWLSQTISKDSVMHNLKVLMPVCYIFMLHFV